MTTTDPWYPGAAPEDPESPSAGCARDKVRTLDEVGRIAERCRASGRSVVQAHGAFDLMHLGHVRHLEAARRLGDVLVVTVTADRFVGKGPGRPVFSADRRAEMLAALQCVDWVAVNHAADAVNAIERIRPSVYAKGRDYQDAQDDVTGKIVLERRACEAWGGRVRFTDEETLSSSALINRHLAEPAPGVRPLLDRLRRDGALEELRLLFERVAGYRALVVGDAIIDDYHYVTPMQKTPKEYLVATRYRDRELFLGGVFAVANQLSSFCKEVGVVTCLGELDRHEDLVREGLRPNVHYRAITRAGAPTTLKRRFVDAANTRKLFEVCFMDDAPLAEDAQARLDAEISRLAPDYDVVVAADFGHGLIAPSSIEEMAASARFLAVNAQSNSANLGYNPVSRYRRADYACIDEAEARLAAGDRVSPVADVARQLIEERMDCPKVVVTRGGHGCLALERGGPPHSIPGLTTRVVDSIGAGDAFLASTAPLVAAGGALEHVAFVGSVAGALAVEVVGHRRGIEKAALVKAVSCLLK